MEDLDDAIRDMKIKGAAGPENIAPRMIQHLNSDNRQHILDLFNHSWKSEKAPQEWRNSTIIPIAKKDKDQSLVASFRPISLTSCLGKLLERIINKRLHTFLESENPLFPF